MLVNEVILIDFDVWICDNSDSFLLLFYFVEEFMETLKIGIIKLEISSAFCIFDIKPQVVHWHLQLIEFIQQTNQIMSAYRFPLRIVKPKGVIRWKWEITSY
jgi:hypothetical protein